jgi:hypothetical protein
VRFDASFRLLCAPCSVLHALVLTGCGSGGMEVAADIHDAIVAAIGDSIVADELRDSDPEVSEVINKRGKRCEYEYECRWVGQPADQTDWLADDDLVSPAARQAVEQFEGWLRAQRHGYRLQPGEVKTLNCCNSVVNVDEVDAKGSCIDVAACKHRLSMLCSQPAQKRQRTQRVCI